MINWNRVIDDEFVDEMMEFKPGLDYMLVNFGLCYITLSSGTLFRMYFDIYFPFYL